MKSKYLASLLAAALLSAGLAKVAAADDKPRIKAVGIGEVQATPSLVANQIALHDAFSAPSPREIG